MSRGLRNPKGDKASISTTTRAKIALNEWLDKTALKPQQGKVVGALVEWFCRQDPIVTTAVTSNIDKGMEHAYAAALRKLADDLINPPMASKSGVVSQVQPVNDADKPESYLTGLKKRHQK